jgi:hypothetical protein
MRNGSLVQRGPGTVAGEAIFYIQAASLTSTMRIFVNGVLQDTKAVSGARCRAAAIRSA